MHQGAFNSNKPGSKYHEIKREKDGKRQREENVRPSPRVSVWPVKRACCPPCLVVRAIRHGDEGGPAVTRVWASGTDSFKGSWVGKAKRARLGVFSTNLRRSQCF